MSRHLVLAASIVCFLATPVLAEVVEEKFDDGKVKLKYNINDDKQKDGAFTEFYPNGKPKVKADYKAGQLQGVYTTYFENGKVELTETYKAGKRTGLHTEYTEKGAKRLTVTYRDDQLDGPLTQYEDGKAVFVLPFKNGEPVYPKSAEQIEKTIAKLMEKDAGKDAEATERNAALRRLKAYRYLCDIPYENLVLDDDMNTKSLAGAKLCEKIGRIDHKPANPGLPEDEYKLGFQGTSQSNLAQGYPNLTTAVDGWMDDSDDSNVDRLGHRRWCLNPAMQKVGFGRSGKFEAMFAFDRSLKKVPDFDFISFPPRGLTPNQIFGPNHAWNVSFNPAKFGAPDANVKVTVQEADEMFRPVGDPFKLNSVRIDNQGFGVQYCLIFRPEKLDRTAGKRYLVTVTGLTTRPSKLPATVRYPVEFMALK